jgi:hypothetical protein
MKYKGNYKSWIDPQWIDHMSCNSGIVCPDQLVGEQLELEKYQHFSHARWRVYNHTNTDLYLEPPLELNQSWHWWMVRQDSGDSMPVHRDPHAVLEKNVRRFWMPLQDYVRGHVFVYEDSMIVNYTAGDLYEFNNEDAEHFSANLGFEPRYTLMFSTRD